MSSTSVAILAQEKTLCMLHLLYMILELLHIPIIAMTFLEKDIMVRYSLALGKIRSRLSKSYYCAIIGEMPTFDLGYYPWQAEGPTSLLLACPMDSPVFVTNPCVFKFKIIFRRAPKGFNMDNDGVVTKVAPSSRASLKGIQEQDVVTHINGTELDAASAHSVAYSIILRDTAWSITFSRLVSVDTEDCFESARKHVLRLCNSSQQIAIGN